MNLKELKQPFPAEDIEWRIAERGAKGNGEQWAKVLAYVTNRAIQDRLDNVCGPENWRNEYTQIPGAFLCGLSIRIGDEWVTKWDGAQESQIEATKGGLSGAMKRAAVQWGIGRYLYDLDQGWANIHSGGQNYAGKDAKKNLAAMKWDPPQLPAWALPKGEKPQQRSNGPHQAKNLAKKSDIDDFIDTLTAFCADKDLDIDGWLKSNSGGKVALKDLKDGKISTHGLGVLQGALEERKAQ